MWVEVSKHKVFIKIFTQVEHISKWRSTCTCAIGIANTNVDFKTLYKIKKEKEVEPINSFKNTFKTFL
jgi:hypothetical protein